MMSLKASVETSSWYAVQIICVFLLTVQLAALIQVIRDSRSCKVIFLNLLNTAFCFLVFFVLMDVCDYLLKEQYHPLHHAIMRRLFELPILVYAGLEVLIALFFILLLRESSIYRRKHLTPEAIRETVDLLPEGICFSGNDGTVLLSNLKMNVLCRTLTGSVLANADQLWQTVKENGEDHSGQVLVRVSGEEVWRFSRTSHTYGNRQIGQITATDVTQQYRVIEELRQKNDRLQDIQRRMKAAGDLSADMFIAQEEANARAALHNHLGQVLLMGRYYLEHPDNTDARVVQVTTQEMNRILLGEAREADQSKEDELLNAIAAVKSIGVSVVIEGTVPEINPARSLLSQAIQECAVNAAKHAEGDRLNVKIEKNCFSFTNNGKPPKGPIAESGGLLALRRAVETAGGQMKVQSEPAFLLTILLP